MCRLIESLESDVEHEPTLDLLTLQVESGQFLMCVCASNSLGQLFATVDSEYLLRSTHADVRNRGVVHQRSLRMQFG